MRAPRPCLAALRLAAAASAVSAVLLALAWAGSYVRAAVIERKSGSLQPPPGLARIPLPTPASGERPPPTPLAPGKPVWTFHAITTTLVSRRGVVMLTRADAPSLAAHPEELAHWGAHRGWKAGLYPASKSRERTARWLYDGPTQWRAASFGCYEVGIGGAIARVVHVPHWFLVVLAGGPPALWWAVRRRRMRRERVGRCPRCGYSLAGLPRGAGCPECGGRPETGAAPAP